ncbi:acyl carrier protein [Dactylosporangium roseum]|uniref:Acyl carrier protein n=1 Tax=Dactylosporangium roseum TaxID=47989 RepID=A0ABY5ZFP6_9ACTN|nr:acyl carrier protein [Dactylosporangium roseum]
MDSSFTAMLRPFLKYTGQEDLTPDARLRDLGLDSMQAIELLFCIEDEFGVTLPDDKLVDATFETAGALWSAIDELRPAVREAS